MAPHSAWEEAYLRFETPDQQKRKFLRRLRRAGATSWDRHGRVLELFCGIGKGIEAWQELGYSQVTGVDLSAGLLRQAPPGSRAIVGDVRALPLAPASFDAVCVQGGLHHLDGPEPLRLVLGEVRRMLVPGGRFLAIEPWDTPFLRFVHGVASRPLAQRVWPRLEAFDAMARLEAETYWPWLGRPAEILEELDRHFAREEVRTEWGKLYYMGRCVNE